VRIGLLDRIALVEPPVISVAAPSGYGKTTLLAQWVEREGPRAAWVTADERDDDPAVLLSTVAAALDRIDPLPPEVIEGLEGRRPVRTGIARLVAWLAADRDPFTLAIDQADTITNPEAFEVITGIALQLPEQHRLLVASRVPPRWPAPRMRANGRLFELGADDLALEPKEAAELLRRSGVELQPDDVEELTARTEGWAAGLYLAALSMQTGAPDRPRVPPRGSHPYLAEYLRSEVLDHLPAEQVTFLTRTSILDRLGVPLCDAVLDTSESASWLAEAADRNLFLHALDDEERWYRVHHLFRDLLSAALRRNEPTLVPALHQRAAVWYEANGMPEIALEHAHTAGDIERTVVLIGDLMHPTWAVGRADTVMRWLGWLADEDLFALDPSVVAGSAMMFALAGRPIEAERWADAVLATTRKAPLPDGSSTDALLAYLKAFLCREGVEAMRADAQAAYDGFSPDHPFRSSMRFAEGVALRLMGRADEADATLAHAVDLAKAFESDPLTALTLVERGGLAMDSGDWAAAARFIDEAMALVGDGTYDEYWSSAVVFASAARLAAHRGDVPGAQALLARATRLRPLLTYALPVTAVRTLVEMARAYVAIGDHSGAGGVIRQARDILQRRPGLGALPDDVEAMQVLPGGGSSLTAAELRVVPLLSSHLTLQEIADRLFLSRHTVKTHSISVYRKLGVSSRREAIGRLQEMGLLVT
jgi:LuxR family maltose regulon positive regulatory protein